EHGAVSSPARHPAATVREPTRARGVHLAAAAIGRAIQNVLWDLISFPPAVDARKQAMISRQWVGVTRPDAAAQYVTHLKTETFPKLEQIPGFRGAALYRREVSDGVEFRVVTTWESLDAVRKFAG